MVKCMDKMEESGKELSIESTWIGDSNRWPKLCEERGRLIRAPTVCNSDQACRDICDDR
jgi:hypothetical protein